MGEENRPRTGSREHGVDVRLKPKRPKVRVVFFGGHTYPFPTQWRWWEVGSPGDSFDILTTEELHERISEWSIAGHVTIGHLPDDGEVEEVLSRLEKLGRM
jgi:hypothetical protein